MSGSRKGREQWQLAWLGGREDEEENNHAFGFFPIGGSGSRKCRTE
jgi:hypothetical protein